MKKEVMLTSTDGVNNLRVIVWETQNTPKAIMQISHGMIEYMDRYDEFAEFLNSRDILVIGNDHLGHGPAVKSDDDLGYFGPGKNITVVNDLHAVTEYAKKTYGDNIPFVLFGHSMGSFMAREYIMTYGNEIDAAIICGTGYTPRAVLGFGRALTSIIGVIKGEKNHPSLIQKIAFGAYLKKIPNAKTGSDWLSRDEEIVNKYINGKYTTFTFSVNGYKTLFGALAFIEKKANIKKTPTDLPIFMIAGDEDPVGNYGQGVKIVYNQYKSLGVKDLVLKLYEGYRHEIHNEIGREIVYEDVASYIEGHLKLRRD